MDHFWWSEAPICCTDKPYVSFSSRHIIDIINYGWSNYNYNKSDHKYTTVGTRKMTNKPVWLNLPRFKEHRGDIRWDADLNMINGGPGLSIPSGAEQPAIQPASRPASQPAPDRPAFKAVDPAISPSSVWPCVCPELRRGHFGSDGAAREHNRGSKLEKVSRGFWTRK